MHLQLVLMNDKTIWIIICLFNNLFILYAHHQENFFYQLLISCLYKIDAVLFNHMHVIQFERMQHFTTCKFIF